jgi:hypothetical protein
LDAGCAEQAGLGAIGEAGGGRSPTSRVNGEKRDEPHPRRISAPGLGCRGHPDRGVDGAGVSPIRAAFLGTGNDYPIAVSDALLAASGFMLLALLMALTELRRRWHRPQRPALTDGRLHPLS